jgi:hypothetical protein
MFEKKKNTTTTSITFFDGFVAKTKDSNFHNLFWWFCYEEGDCHGLGYFWPWIFLDSMVKIFWGYFGTSMARIFWD